MSIALQKATGKPIMPIRLRPRHKEGLSIHYQLRSLGSSFTKIASDLSIQAPTVSNVVSGRRRSARIESEIARLLGKADWNEVVLEARSEAQKKPVAVILREMEQKKQAVRKRMEDYSAENYERVFQLIPDGSIAQKEQE